MTGAPTLEPVALRSVFGRLPTGVVVVAAQSDTGPVGMSCNSFTSVSLEPPLAGVCVGRSSQTWPLIAAAGRLCISVLPAGVEPLARHFSARGVDRFADVAWHARPGGPALDDAIAWVDGRIADVHDAGDHLFVTVRVLAAESGREAAPLVFFRGRYGSFAPDGDAAH